MRWSVTKPCRCKIIVYYRDFTKELLDFVGPLVVVNAESGPALGIGAAADQGRSDNRR